MTSKLLSGHVSRPRASTFIQCVSPNLPEDSSTKTFLQQQQSCCKRSCWVAQVQRTALSGLSQKSTFPYCVSCDMPFAYLVSFWLFLVVDLYVQNECCMQGHSIRLAISGADSKHFYVDHAGTKTLWVHTGPGRQSSISLYVLDS